MSRGGRRQEGMWRRCLSGGAGGLPASIGGLVWWLDGSYGVTDAGSGAVSSWLDRSPSGNHVTQGTAGNRPTTTTLNGRPAILFDGTDDFLEKTSAFAGIGAAASITAFTVGSATTNQNSAFWDLTTDQTLTNRGFAHLYEAAGTTMTFRASDAGGVEDAEYAYTVSATARIWTMSHATATRSITENGVAKNTNSNAKTGLAIVAARVGRLHQNVFNHAGKIGEIIIYNRALAVAEVDAVESYLGARWGITVS